MTPSATPSAPPLRAIERLGGARIPAVGVRAALAAIGIALALVDHGPDGWFIVGAALAVLAALAPRSLLVWALILVLAAGAAVRHPELGWRVLILVAGVHLLHVLGMLSLELPWQGRVAPEVLTAPLRRLVAVQVPVQVVAALCLLLLAPGAGGHRPFTLAALAVIGGIALAGVGLLLLGPRPE